jgi:carbamoyl-phosphate synthase large subunit
MAKLTIGITGLGSLIGQAIIKSINKSALNNDISMVGFDYLPNTVGGQWVGKEFLLPDFYKKEASEQDWLGEIIRIICSEGIKIIFIGLDFELKLFAKYKESIEKNTGCKVMVSNLKVVEIADDKYLTYKFLKDNGFYYPETFLPNEIAEGKISFPCILKPRIGSRSRGIFIVNNIQELERKMRQVDNSIIQNLAGSPDLEYTCGVICLDGQVKEIIVLRRTLKDGNTETAFFNKDTPGVIYDYIYDVTRKLQPYGACNFQLRLDEKNIPRLFEINVRHSGTTYIRAMFGFNEVEYIITHLMGLKPKKFTLKEGTIKRFYDEAFIDSKRE